MDDRLEHLKESVTHRYERLEESKKLGIFVHASKRFFGIEGLDLSGLLALELFTTIIPLVLLGYGFLHDFSTALNFGDFLIRWMDLTGESAETVRGLFGSASDLRSTWTFFGIAGFLFWGIPMSSQVAKVFARAFRRERWPFWAEVWRGGLWFILLLVSEILMVTVSPHLGFFGRGHPWNLGALVPTFVLWSVSPFLLVRNGTNGWRHMAWCGLAGLVLDLFGVRIVLKFVFPKLLTGWTDFGPIGVAMAIMTTCTVVATLWVITACLGAVLWERNAPAATVIDAQMGRSEAPMTDTTSAAE